MTKRNGKKRTPQAGVVAVKVANVKINVLNALVECHGVVSDACLKVGLSRVQFYRYCRDDPEFKMAVNDAHEQAIDFVESQLFQNIAEGKEISILFFLKCRAKNRGYIERTELDVRSQTEVTHKIESLKSLTDDQLNQLSEIAKTLDGSE